MLTSISFSKLISVQKAIEISSNKLLKTISMPLLENATGGFTISANDVLTALTVSSLERSSSFTLHTNPLLTTANFPALITLSSGLSISDNDHLKTLSCPALTAITNGNFDVHTNSLLETATFAVLEKISGTLNFYGHPFLQDLANVFPSQMSITRVGEFTPSVHTTEADICNLLKIGAFKVKWQSYLT